MNVPAHVHLLDRWLSEDVPHGPAVQARVRPGDIVQSGDLPAGLAPLLDPEGRVRRAARGARPVPVREAASAVRGALLARGGTASWRGAALAARLCEEILPEAHEAMLVTMIDPVTGEPVEDEVHADLRWASWPATVRISVVPRTTPAGRRDPACDFAGCSGAVRTAASESGPAEARLRAVCAGNVLADLLGCDGPAAFSIGWEPHGIAPGTWPDHAAVRAWWDTTSWRERYVDDYLDLDYDYGAGGWMSSTHLVASGEDPGDDLPGEGCDALGDHARPATGPWVMGDELRFMNSAVFLDEVEAFCGACRDQTGAGDLADALLGEILVRPLERVGGPERRMLVWADADETGEFWRDSAGEIDVYGDARRLLIVGPTEALYMVFKGEAGI
ncbi:hypothetical protein ACFY4C_04900 [Actinomadura viridis]|uniref:hypothetical protein n=1 Tax=Actinomadura viridis TaxID=58110 RepID=UPI0036B044CA